MDQTRRRRRTKGSSFIIFVLLAAVVLISAVTLLSDRRGGEEATAHGGAGAHELSDYPKGFAELYEKNEDARGFVLDYFNDRTALSPEEIELSELSDLSAVPLLMQWDERWGYAEYAGNFFGLSGCGPTCFSMSAIYLTGDTSLNPLKIAEFSEKNGYATKGNGTAWTLFSEGASAFGISATELPLSQGVIDQHVSAGEPVVLIMGPGDFTDSGHFIVIAGITDGGYEIRDPNSRKNSDKTWQYDDIKDQIRNLWALSLV